MKKYLLGGLAALLFTACSDDEAKPISLPQETDDPWQKSVSREISKHDAWVEWEVRDDYSKDQEKRITLRRVPDTHVKEMSEHGVLGTHGTYDPFTDTLELRDSVDEQATAGSLDALDHELFHALFDEQEKKGIIFSPQYRGPSVEEITQYAKQRVSSDAFASVRKNLHERVMEETIDVLINHLVNYLNRIDESFDKAFERTGEIFESNKEYRHLISDEDRKELADAYIALKDRHVNFAVVREDIGQQSDKNEAEYGNRELSLEDMIKLRDNTLACIEQCKPYLGVIEASRDLVENYRRIFGKAKDIVMDEKISEYDAKIAEYEKRGDSESANEYRSMRQGILSRRKLSQSVDSFLAITRHSEAELHKLQDEVTNQVANSNIDTINKILDDPNEIMARLVDSLYSLYTGPVTQNLFPLTNTDLEFLDRFKYQRDGNEQPLFRKGVERYRVMLALIADSTSPQDAKSMLEYATQYTHKRPDGSIVKYSWPAAKFEIKGSVPLSQTVPGAK